MNEQIFVEFALAMPLGNNRDEIASRAELWSKYGRDQPQSPIRWPSTQMRRFLTPLAGVNVL